MVLDSVARARQQRWRFLETALIWEGSINLKRVADAFQMAKNHVSKDFTAYQERCPGNIFYNNRQKTYLAGPKFTPILASGNPAEYLLLQQMFSESNNCEALRPVVDPGLVDVGTVPQPVRCVDKAVLQSVVQAIKQRAGLKMHYDTLNAAKGKSSRTVWPHALAFDGQRWHMRALDGERNDFRDYVLGRIKKSEVTRDAPPRPLTSDQLWNQLVTAEVMPNPALDLHAQRVIAEDHGMIDDGTGWVWVAETRAAMLPYFVSRYGLYREGDSPMKARLVLRNWEALRHLLFVDWNI